MLSPNVKMIPPRRQPRTLRRVRLLDTLHNNIQRKVLFVCAPAGYGKTTLMVDFTEDVDAVVYWYRISTEDDNLPAFYENVLQAFQANHPDFGSDLSLAGQERSPAPEELAFRLINALEETLDDFSLFVLDDYHLVSTDPEIVDFVEAFISYLPDQLRLLIGSRNVYGIPTALLYVQEQFAIISEEDLKFQQEEIVDLCWKYYHIQLTDEQARRILEQAEGWIVAILLALRSENLSMEIPKVLGAREHVYTYLAEEVIHTLPGPLIDFLYATSLVDEFSVPLANHILEINNAREIIKQLDELNLFLSSSSEPGSETSFRYHQLFADFLQGNLQDTDPDRLKTLHHRIADWYQNQDQNVQAISHYFKAGEPQNAVHLIDGISRQMYLSGQTRLLEQWYELISSSNGLVAQAPELLLNLAKAVSNHGEGSRAKELLEMARAPLLDREDYSSYANLLVTLGVTNVHQGAYQEAHELALAAQAEVEKHDLDRYYWAQAERLKGLCASSLGNLETAFESLKKAADELRNMLEPNFLPRQAHELAATLSDKALTALSMGNIFEAQSSYRDALDLARRMQSDYPLLTMVYNNYGYLNYLLGDYLGAWKYYLQGLEVAELSNYEWFTCHLLNGQGEVLADLGEWDRAEAAFQKAIQYAERFEKKQSQASAISGLIEVEVQRGDFNQAMYYLREMARVQDQNMEEPGYQLRLSLIYQAMGQNGLAQQAFEGLLDSESDSKETPVSQDRVILHLHYAGLLMEMDESARAEEHVSIALEIVARLGYDQFLVNAIRDHLPVYERILKEIGSPQAKSLLLRARKLLPSLAELIADRQEDKDEGEAPIVLNVTGLDQGEVRLNGSVLPHRAWSSVGARALFYFMLDRKRVTKEEIALEFWPDFSQAKINSNFHATLWRVRKALGSKTIIEFDDGRYFFSPSAKIYFDVDEFEDQLKVIDTTDNPVERRTAMRRVVELYQTDFIEDIDMPWADERRFELQGRFRTVLADLARDQFEKKNLSAALDLFQRAIELDPYQDDHHLRIMQCLTGMGDKNSALLHYQQYAKSLKQEMGISPDESLAQFAEEIS